MKPAHTYSASLSAYLYEQSKDSIYLDAAEATASFINSLMLSYNKVVGQVDLFFCPTSGDDPGVEKTHSYDSGFFIEGLALLANLAGNGTYSDLYVCLCLLT